MEPVRGADPLPAWASCLPEPGVAQALYTALAGEAGSVESAVQALSGRSQQAEASDKQQRETLLKVHQRLVELAEERGTPYGAAFEAYMLHAGGRCGGGGKGSFGCLCTSCRCIMQMLRPCRELLLDGSATMSSTPSLTHLPLT